MPVKWAVKSICSAFTKMLESVTHYDMDGPMLLLLSDGELRAVFQARP